MRAHSKELMDESVLGSGVSDRGELSPVAMETTNEMQSETVKIPKLPPKYGDQFYLVKLPNFISLEKECFDETTFKGERLDERYQDSEGRVRHKLKIHNTIRWRQKYNHDGQLTKESNSRFVRWSDGSMTLHVGSEVFDVITTPINHTKDHLFLKQGDLLMSQGVFDKRMTFCPSSTDSQTHKRVIGAVADRALRTQKVKLLTTICDDNEKERLERIKIEEEKLKAFEKMDMKRQKRKEKSLNESRLSSALFDAENETDTAVTVHSDDASPQDENDIDETAQEIFGTDSESSSSTDIDSDDDASSM